MACRVSLPGAVMAGLCLPSLAAGTEMSGEWCHPDRGTALFWEERSLGLGEHTICDWESPPAGRIEVTTQIHCHTIHLNGDEVTKTNPRTHRFQARLTDAQHLQVQFNDDTPVLMNRCP